MFSFLPLLLVSLLGGCPDPSTAPTPQMGGAPGEGGPGGPGGPGAGGPPPEGGAAPMPGAGSPGGDPGSNQGPPPPIGFSVTPGEGDVLKGTITYKGSKAGKVRLDFLKVVDNNPPMLAHTMELQALGEWSVEAPKDFGDVRVVGFLDQTGDGPSRDDPAMAWPDVVKIAQTPVSGIDLVLSDNPDLGVLTPGPGPGSAPPVTPGSGGPSGPPPGGSPPLGPGVGDATNPTPGPAGAPAPVGGDGNPVVPGSAGGTPPAGAK